jgi:hypothetical protein
VVTRKKDRVDVIQKYTVKGDVRDVRAWTREVLKPPPPD